MTELKELYAALIKAHSEMEFAEKDSNNPFFKSKYADFTSIVKASRPCLTKHGLTIHQEIIETGDDKPHILITRLIHSSGQYTESRLRLTPLKNDPQSFASYLSYMRRYAYMTVAGVIAADDDDDAEIAMHTLRSEPKAWKQKPFDRPVYEEPITEKITAEQNEILMEELKGDKDLLAKLFAKYHIGDLSQLDKKDFNAVFNRLREINRDKPK